MSSTKRTTPSEFRAILGFPAYRVNSDGRFQSCFAHDGWGKFRMTDQWRDLPGTYSRGYLKVHLRGRDGIRFVGIHVLVLECFVGPRPFPGAHCRHLDGDPTNNRLDNLKWGTCQENKDDELRHGRRNRGSRNGCARLTEADIPEIRKLLKEGKLLQREIGEQFGVHIVTISNIKCGTTWKHVKG